MTKFKDKTILITGGASGIGLLMVRAMVQKSAARIIILDIDSAAIEDLETEFKASDCSVICFKTDIADEDELKATYNKIEQNGFSIDILINNAGVVTGKAFSEHTPGDIDRNMQINAIAPMKLTALILPEMLKRKQGYIINISSAASMLSNPGMSVYCASKWAMTGWSDSLRLEMERGKTGVKVLTVTPYYIDTGMFRGVRSPIIPILKPAKVVAKIIKAIEQERIILRTPRIIYVLPLVKGILPKRLLDLVIGRFFGIYTSMDEFKGRTDE